MQSTTNYNNCVELGQSQASTWHVNTAVELTIGYPFGNRVALLPSVAIQTIAYTVLTYE